MLNLLILYPFSVSSPFWIYIYFEQLEAVYSTKLLVSLCHEKLSDLTSGCSLYFLAIICIILLLTVFVIRAESGRALWVLASSQSPWSSSWLVMGRWRWCRLSQLGQVDSRFRWCSHQSLCSKVGFISWLKITWCYSAIHMVLHTVTLVFFYAMCSQLNLTD